VPEGDEEHVRADEERHVANRQGQVTGVERPGQCDVGDDEAQWDEQEDRQQKAELDPAPGDPHQPFR
jgi:hypothetical protein